MAKSETEKRPSDAAGVDTAFSVFNAVVDSSGRRNVHIFAVPREYLIMAVVTSLLFVIFCGIPGINRGHARSSSDERRR